MATTNRKSRSLLADPNLESVEGFYPNGINLPFPAERTTPIEYAQIAGETFIALRGGDRRSVRGHYQTPPAIARFMAGGVPYVEPQMRVLDPGCGTGILSAAVCEEASRSGIIRSLHIDAYETDPLLASLTWFVLDFSRQWLSRRGIELSFDVKHEDFILAYDAMQKRSNPVGQSYGIRMGYDLVISNPPYFKIGKDDPRAVIGAEVVHGQPNIYALFMAISAELLAESGRLIFIVPRSFASGAYFNKFRQNFFRRVTPTSIHLFDSRRDVFASQAVLQENLVMFAERQEESAANRDKTVYISHSKGMYDLSERAGFFVELDFVLDRASPNLEIRIPSRAEDLSLVQTVQSWPNNLRSLGLDVSTGPVVPFRASELLSDTADGNSTVPLLWMHNVRPMNIGWMDIETNKPQWIQYTPKSMKLLVPDQTYVLLRRFSAKEERRRLVAAPLLRGHLGAKMVGLENHLNYVRGTSRMLDEEMAYGVAALLNSTFLDRYFRLSNGNTQASAAELRAMPLPSERLIRSIGNDVQGKVNTDQNLTNLDAIVAQHLGIPSHLWLM